MFTFANVCSALALSVALGTGTAYAADTIFSTDIVDGEVKTADLHANAVTSNKIKDGTIQAVDVADAAITGQQLANDSVGSNAIISESVGVTDIATNAVNASEIADDSIDSGEIVNDSLGAVDLAPGSVGASEIGDGAVGSAEIVDNAIGGADVANNSLSTADIKGTDSNGTISLGAGSVANGRCKDYDITVGGAVTNEVIVISTRAALPEGLLIYGVRVPANGHGIMKLCNFTGGVMPAIVDFPIRTITYG